MAIPVPTIDQFKDTTVMRTMRKIVDYIIEDVVPAINEGGGGTGEVNITQDVNGININGIQLQEATNTQDGLVTKEQVKAIEDNTALGDSLTKELVNGVVVSEGATSGTIKVTLEQEDGTTIPSNDFTLPSGGGGSEWELLDLNNFPTDFTNNDILKIEFKLASLGYFNKDGVSDYVNIEVCSIIETKPIDKMCVPIISGMYGTGNYRSIGTSSFRLSDANSINNKNSFGSMNCYHVGGVANQNNLSVGVITNDIAFSKISLFVNKIYRKIS